MKYEPTLESLRQHSVPEWYDDAKLGVLITWGLYSVPGWAPVGGGDIVRILRNGGWKAYLANNPYSEWYLNSMRVPGSPTRAHHIATYGADFAYDDFVPLFNDAATRWDPAEWAELFSEAGARYVVLTTRHCDSFLLWPSAHSNPFKGSYRARRDIVGDLTEAVRARDLRMGLYYCGGYDWTFNQAPLVRGADSILSVPQTQEYADYCVAHWRELIERYRPSVLWGDVGFPPGADLPALFADYYNRVPDGVVNDRFYRVDLRRIGRLLRTPPAAALVGWLAKRAFLSGRGVPHGGHYDFTTPEYTSRAVTAKGKWETTRGIGYSFGYNQNETEDHQLSVKELVHLLVDVVSKNGNLLIGVGPMANGTIPTMQRERLMGLGRWLAVNGEAIFGTRPWTRSEGTTTAGTPVRFTQKGDSVYAILLDPPPATSLTLDGLSAGETTSVRLIGEKSPVHWQQTGDRLTVTLPEPMPASPAHVLQITPRPSA